METKNHFIVFKSGNIAYWLDDSQNTYTHLHWHTKIHTFLNKTSVCLQVSISLKVQSMSYLMGVNAENE